MIDTNAMMSIAEENQIFLKMARLVDGHETAVILKNSYNIWYFILTRQ